MTLDGEFNGVERSLMLLKPDGARSAAVRKDLLDGLASKGLQIQAERIVHLSEDEIVQLWPMFRSPAHAIMREFYFRYMREGVCVAFLVSGARAVEDCCEVKHSLRAKYEACAFENALHCPSDAYERDINLETLFSIQVPQSALNSPPEDNRVGFHGKAAGAGPSDFRAMVARIWADKERGGWPATFVAKAAGRYDVVVLPGDPNPIDYGICVLHDHLDLPLETAMRLYIESEVRRGAAVRSGEHDEIADLAAMLKDKGLRVVVRERAALSES
ncbi:MAG: nucleoside-diphosphate kinase [Phenylobacterium sp.]|uniref:nucleoside-diphosphate kinase n=1 Tax=Phenylobacterium sp. TaxID=1871053 RepID=UPI002734FFAB|nr:nucleoside-diphosphate kinase [Phenylobacterium sp.]MDP3745641.1 nucleoside-diphosphate kinase [Phenylobacterium sp.]